VPVYRNLLLVMAKYAATSQVDQKRWWRTSTARGSCLPAP